MAWIEVSDVIGWDLAHSQIQTILISNVDGYSSSAWCRKLFGNGSGGYYIPVPDGIRGGSDDLEEFLLDYTILDTLPSASPPGSYTPISVTDDIIYDTTDFIDLGRPITGVTVSEQWELVKPNGDKYFLILFRNGQTIIVDVANETYLYYASDIFKPWKPIYDTGTDTIVFMSAIGNSLFKYDIATASITYSIADFGAGDPGGLQDRAKTTDGQIIMGTNGNPTPKLWKYNPSTNAVTLIATFPTSSVGEYIYTMGGDADYSYAKLRYNGNYRLASVRHSDGQITFYGSYADEYKGGYQFALYHDNSKNLDFWIGGLGGSAVGAAPIDIKMINGVNDPTLSPNVHLENETQGYLPFSKSIEAYWSITYDTSEVSGVKTGISSLKYPSSIVIDFTEVEFESFALGRFTSNNDGSRLLCNYGQYAPLFTWNTGTDAVDVKEGGFGQSNYDFFDIDGSKYLFCGYPNDTRIWDSGSAWDGGPLNPLKINEFGISNAYYHRKFAKSGNTVYLAFDLERSDEGCGFGWWDITQPTSTITNIDATMKAQFSIHNISDMFVMNGGDRLVVLCRRRVGASYVKMFIYDISSDKDLRNLTPIEKDMPFVTNAIGWGYPVSTNIFMGINQNIAYKVDLTNLSNITYKNLPGPIYGTPYARPIAQTADGKLWFICRPATQTFLYELDPVAFTAKKKTADLGPLVYQRGMAAIGSSSLYFLGGVEGVNTSSDNLEKLVL